MGDWVWSKQQSIAKVGLFFFAPDEISIPGTTAPQG